VGVASQDAYRAKSACLKNQGIGRGIGESRPGHRWRTEPAGPWDASIKGGGADEIGRGKWRGMHCRRHPGRTPAQVGR